jgi:GrpB-like predicted nucleotidyltransferase (UPF0157 family)
MRPVEIVDYDPSWPVQFAAERDELRALLGNLLDDVHHIGSTSVPSLAAKPKIDMDAVLRADDFVQEAVERVRVTGAWDYHGDPYGDGRWTFTRGRSRGTRLYLCGPGNEAHEKRILFRDWLRTHREDAAAYEALKRRLAAEANGDWKFYTGGKSAFVAEIVRQAKAQLISPLEGEMVGRPDGCWAERRVAAPR